MDSRKTLLVKSMVKNFVSELVGTAIILFLGCMGVCRGMGQPGDHTGIMLSFASAVVIAIQVTSLQSGAHVNPAVTIMSLFFRKLDLPMAGVYIMGQMIGGIVGFGFLKVLTPSDRINANGNEQYGLCTTVPNPDISLVQALLSEFLFTFLLMLIVCSCWDPRNVHLDAIGVKFGLAIFSLGYAGAHYSGCSMNPARSFAPAVWNQVWTHHWIYWVGPMTAALLCGFVYTTFFCPKSNVVFSSNQKLNKEELEMNSA